METFSFCRQKALQPSFSLNSVEISAPFRLFLLFLLVLVLPLSAPSLSPQKLSLLFSVLLLFTVYIYKTRIK